MSQFTHRRLAITWILQLLLLNAFFFCPVWAHEIKYQTRDGSITVTGAAPVNKLGTLLADKALAIISQNQLSIEGKDKSGNNRFLVAGKLIKVEERGTGKRRFLTGYFVDSNCQDNPIATITSRQLGARQGRIGAVTGQALELHTTGGVIKIAEHDITDISSACVYNFKLKLTDAVSGSQSNVDAAAGNMEFLLTQTSTAAKTDRKGATLELLSIAGGAGMSLLMVGGVAAIAIPVALVSRGSRVAKQSNNLLIQTLFGSANNTSTTPSTGGTSTGP